MQKPIKLRFYGFDKKVFGWKRWGKASFIGSCLTSRNQITRSVAFSNSSHFLSPSFASPLSLNTTDLQKISSEYLLHFLFPAVSNIFLILHVLVLRARFKCANVPLLGLCFILQWNREGRFSIRERLRLKLFTFVRIFTMKRTREKNCFQRSINSLTCLSLLSPITPIKHDELNNSRHFDSKMTDNG